MLSAHETGPFWFAAFIQNHIHSVSIADTHGTTKIHARLPNKIGVSQGSALGPAFFCVFANGLKA